MENRRNYYRILHVQADAPVEIIRASYRTLMQRLRAHPDLGGDHWNASLINEAYAVLTNPERRAEYDRHFRGRPAPRSPAPPTPSAPATDTSDATGRLHTTCFFCGAPRQPGRHLAADAVCGTCRSPLYPAARRRLEGSSKRAIERLVRRDSLVLFTRWPQSRGEPGELRDISLNGIRFVTAADLMPGALVKIDSDVCRAVARVANVRDSRGDGPGLHLVGAEFVSVLFPRPRGAFVSAEA